MATRLYFHAANSAVGGTLPAAEQSALTAALSVDAQTVNRNMDTNIGSSATSRTFLSANATRDIYITKFVSPPIYQTSIAANTWTYAFTADEDSATPNFPVNGANQPVYLNVYVWKPSSGTKVGTILDGNTASTVDEGGVATKVGHVVTFTGSAVAGLTSGDAVIVAEIWFRVASTVLNITCRYYFDGATTVVENATNAASASYVETPEDLLLSFVIPQTVFVEWEES